MNVWTVRQINEHVKQLVEGDFKLAGVAVKGEISNFSRSPQGHVYFTLKEEGYELKAVWWRSDAARSKLAPDNGMQVVALGRVAVYETGGRYQLVVSELRLDGLGELYAAFVQLQQKLRAEGLFDEGRKQPIPTLPTRVGIVTSPSGAALRDMIVTIQRRHPGVHVLLAPAVVQGADAPQSIVNALRRLYKMRNTEHRVDVIIVGRGGGSFEDLNAFNDEAVARAIAGCPIPIVSGVGHETDTTIADLVADARAATPTAAAERVTPLRSALVQSVAELRERLRRGLMQRLERARERYDGLEHRRAYLTADRVLDSRRQRLDELGDRLAAAARRQLQRQQAGLGLQAARLEALSPLKVLARGYVVCRSPQGEVVTHVEQAWRGRLLELALADGHAAIRVERAAPARELIWSDGLDGNAR